MVSDQAKPPIPDAVIAKWQRVVDILARIVNVPAGLIMKAEPPQHNVFVTSATEGNPYGPEISFTLNTGLYCDTVMAERSLLIVPNAMDDPLWNRNPDLEHGMVFYMGFPLTWPDGTTESWDAEGNHTVTGPDGAEIPPDDMYAGDVENPDGYRPRPEWQQVLSRVSEGQQTTLGAYSRPWQ